MSVCPYVHQTSLSKEYGYFYITTFVTSLYYTAVDNKSSIYNKTGTIATKQRNPREYNTGIFNTTDAEFSGWVVTWSARWETQATEEQCEYFFVRRSVPDLCVSTKLKMVDSSGIISLSKLGSIILLLYRMFYFEVHQSKLCDNDTNYCCCTV